ncbi:hypothetical protein [Saccharothrix coeruleofusca]|uniref:Uncharacterized protein n=1 Tax=Saccharothrix coeruleofusca TaxID=33919 RepID=A0A918AKV3_9PSEU|nr:hypothetical protein [Saccharothrix coeruleofusca]MBP2336553.1 hypothetical protein [Saccharothrix coeruleofusca]GGP52198.1 hypothetical protein GCM10010185_25360 [Saccharothrix coeruleofusca]
MLPRYLADPALAAGSVELVQQASVPPLAMLFLATRLSGLATPQVALAHRHLLDRARDWGSL